MVNLTGKSRIIGFITAAGTSHKCKELASPLNRAALPKPLFPVGSRGIIDFPLDTLHRMNMGNSGGIFINYRPETKEVISYLNSVSSFYDRSAIIPFEEATLNGSAGSLLNLVKRVRIQNDDIVVALAGDTIQNLDVESAIMAHLGSDADATIVVRPIWQNESHRLANCDTVTLDGMPSIGEAGFETKMQDFYSLMAKQGRIMTVKRYNRRKDWKGSQSNLIDASVYIMSGKFVIDYILPQITPRPSWKEEVKTPQEIETLERALRIVKTRGNTLRKEVAGKLDELVRISVQRLTEESEGEFSTHFYNFEHVFYRATRGLFSGNFAEAAERREVKIMAYLMPEQVKWWDVGDVHEVWHVNMEMLKDENIHLLRLEEGKERGLWTKESWGWKSTRNVRINAGAKIIGTSIICDDVSIEDGVEVHNSVLRSGVILRRGAKVINSVIFPKANDAPDNEIHGGVTLTNCLFLGGVLNVPGEYEWETFYMPKDELIRNSFKKGVL